MTPTSTGQVIPTAVGRDLVLERVLPGSIDDGWASITESDRLARWFCTWTGDPQVGGSVELSLVAEEGDAKSHAEIIACEPPTHLAVSTHDQAGLAARGDLDPDRREPHPPPVRAPPRREGQPRGGRPGWEYYLDGLVGAMNGNPMPNWDDYWPSLASAYANGLRSPTPPAAPQP